MANTFRDDGYSGASLNRPGLDRLRDAVRATEVDRVLITDPDRLARNDVHQILAGLASTVHERGKARSPTPRLTIKSAKRSLTSV